ncbi:14249_t:CDS:1, partial [Acaulospora colombiana]
NKDITTKPSRMREECIKRFPNNEGGREVIYISTDVPPQSPALQPFIKEFPCIYTLSDFDKQLEPLKMLRSTGDNKELGKFLLPVVDLMVAAN